MNRALCMVSEPFSYLRRKTRYGVTIFLQFGRGTSLKTLKRCMSSISASIGAVQSFAAGARSASRLVRRSGVVGVGSNAGSSPSNAPNASRAPDPPAKPERVDRTENWWTRPTYWGASSSSSPRRLVGGSSESTRNDMGSGCCCGCGA